VALARNKVSAAMEFSSFALAPLRKTPRPLRTFLTGLIDYAGLFPPARLPLAEALASYHSYLSHPFADLVARFVIPIGQWEAALPLLEAPFSLVKAGKVPPYAFSLLMKVPEKPENFPQEMRRQMQSAKLSAKRGAGAVRVDALEVAPPPLFFRDSVHRKILADLHDEWKSEFPQSSVFLEAPWDAIPDDILATLGAVPEACLKWRTGGLAPAAVPSTEKLAHALVFGVQEKCSAKFTAGLHQPLRHFDYKVGAKVHGFMNVFCAVAAARFSKADVKEVQRVLEVESAEDFVCTAEHLGVQNHLFRWEQWEALRTESALSFGSCSVEEPLEALTHMGWITQLS
jgi:hypothetical protein